MAVARASEADAPPFPGSVRGGIAAGVLLQDRAHRVLVVQEKGPAAGPQAAMLRPAGAGTGGRARHRLAHHKVSCGQLPRGNARQHAAQLAVRRQRAQHSFLQQPQQPRQCALVCRLRQVQRLAQPAVQLVPRVCQACGGHAGGWGLLGRAGSAQLGALGELQRADTTGAQLQCCLPLGHPPGEASESMKSSLAEYTPASSARRVYLRAGAGGAGVGLGLVGSAAARWDAPACHTRSQASQASKRGGGQQAPAHHDRSVEASPAACHNASARPAYSCTVRGAACGCSAAGGRCAGAKHGGEAGCAREQQGWPHQQTSHAAPCSGVKTARVPPRLLPRPPTWASRASACAQLGR